MQYRNNIKNGDRLCALGYGAMRLPTLEGSKKKIDTDKSRALIEEAYKRGVNYYDTAFAYNGGENEKVLGYCVKPFRKEIKLATKLPLLKIKGKEDFAALFYTSLERLGTDYIDYYLIHCILSYSQYAKMVNFGLKEWISKKKAEGSIINIGFSFHGSREDFIQIVDDYDWDFCQIQYNYYDVNFQAGRDGLRYAASKGLPVIIMEPLRGGKLVKDVPDSVKRIFDEAFPGLSLAEIGLRFVLNHPEVTVVLSGMSSEEMLRGNILTVKRNEAGCLSKEDLQVYEKARLAFAKEIRVPCTGCAYCMPCPASVNIPGCFSVYNSLSKGKKLRIMADYVQTCGGLSHNTGFASQCIECGKCKIKCPQGIDIPVVLGDVRRSFEPLGLKSGLKAFKKVKFSSK